MPPEKPYLARAVEPGLRTRLDTFPVVAIVGARQTGKTTLARAVPDRDRLYVTLDDLDVLDQARREPEQLLRRAPRMTVDEVQREPDLLLAIKREVDRERTAGRFLLTGSANLLLMRDVSESLAGRAAYVTLWPLTVAERAGRGRAGRWSTFFEEPVARWRDAVAGAEVTLTSPWEELARRGGYPTPAYQLDSEEQRALWFDGYVRTYLERDLRDLSAIENLADFRRLMRAACLRLGNVLNQAELARDVGLPPSTAQRYLGLLETSYQLIRLEPFAMNRTKRLVKSPKLFWSDTGLALHLAEEARPRGAHLENLVLGDLLTWRELPTPAPRVLYWRTSRGTEVDFVIEWGERVLPVEVKSGSGVRTADARGLRAFLEEYGDLASGGLILHDGEETFWIGEGILAAPWRRVL